MGWSLGQVIDQPKWNVSSLTQARYFILLTRRNEFSLNGPLLLLCQKHEETLKSAQEKSQVASQQSLVKFVVGIVIKVLL